MGGPPTPRGGRYSPLASPPPPKKMRAQLTGPPNPTKTDSRAPEVNRTQIRQKMKMVFLEFARRGGSEKLSFAMYSVIKN